MLLQSGCWCLTHQRDITGTGGQFMLWPVSVLFFLSQDPLIKSIEGKDLYGSYCASCHGMDGKGGGPASAAMKVSPPDLTSINKRHKGKFPATQEGAACKVQVTPKS
jgi:mono/diheme cytochrome c family protein